MDGTGSRTSPGSSGAAHQLLAQKDRLLRLWVERVRQAIPAAAGESHPILIDTMPMYLRFLAEALAHDHPRRSASEGTTIAEEHGGERFRLTHYRLNDLIREYQLLRDVLLEVLSEKQPLTDVETRTLVGSIDKAIYEASTAYVLVAEGLREQFISTLAHDLRSPLTAVKAGAQMILRKPQAPTVPQWAAKITELVDRADTLLRTMLDVSLVRSGGRLSLTLAPCELSTLVREVIEQLELTHGERFRVVAPEPVEGYWSAEALRRAVENLATNAVKYGHGHRPVTLSVRQTHGRALVIVHNEGSYIPRSEQESLFRAFSRSREAEQSGVRGWGLGLALVRGVAEAHGGSISIDSQPERGTSFTIDIPKDSRPYQEAPTTA